MQDNTEAAAASEGRVSQAATLSQKRSIKTRQSLAFNDFRDKKYASSDALRAINIDSERMGGGLCRRYTSKFLYSNVFEYSMGAIIVTNIFVMVVEIDGAASDGQDLSNAPVWTEVFGWAVLFVFTMELLLRLYAFRWNFWMDAWNIFDFTLVSTDLAAFLATLLMGKVFPVTWLRVFRLAKLARVSKVLRVFPELRQLLDSLLSAMSAILWGALLLCIVLLAWAMAAVLFIHPLNKHVEYVDCERCPRAYSSVFNSFMTFWQAVCAGDSWGQTTIPLIEKYPATVCFFIPLFLSVGMAVVSLILGMVVSVAQEAKNDIKEVDTAAATAAKYEKQSNLLKLCKQMDIEDTGQITHDNITKAFTAPGAFRESMGALGITMEDLDVVWALLDSDQSGEVEYKRLVSRLYRMKTNDSNFTLAYLKYHVTLIKEIVTHIEDSFAHQISDQVLEKIQDKIQQVDKKEELVLQCQEQVLEQLQTVVRSASEMRESAQKNEGVHTEVAHMSEHIHYIACAASEKTESGCKSNVVETEAQAQVADREVPQQDDYSWDDGGLHEQFAQISKGLQEHPRDTEAGTVDETRQVLNRISRDIGRLRLEVRDALKDFNRILARETTALSVMEQDCIQSGAHLDLLVVPDKSPSCSLLTRCDQAQPGAASGVHNRFC